MAGTPVRFSDIGKLTDRQTQMFLREIDTRTLSVALKGTRREVRQRVFQNVSTRVAKLIKDEMSHVDASRAPQARTLCEELIGDLVENGLIKWPPGGSAPKLPKLTKAYRTAKRRTLKDARQSLRDMSQDEVTSLFVGLAEIAKSEGILSRWAAQRMFRIGCFPRACVWLSMVSSRNSYRSYWESYPNPSFGKPNSSCERSPRV